MQTEYVTCRQPARKNVHRLLFFFHLSEKSKRTDSGKYELTLRNGKGEVKVPIDVTVIGRIGILFSGIHLLSIADA